MLAEVSANSGQHGPGLQGVAAYFQSHCLELLLYILGLVVVHIIIAWLERLAEKHRTGSLVRVLLWVIKTTAAICAAFCIVVFILGATCDFALPLLKHIWESFKKS